MVIPQPYIWEGLKGKPSKKVKPFDLKTRKTIDRDIIKHSEAYIREQAGRGNPFFLISGAGEWIRTTDLLITNLHFN
jgi:hypothetical protein